MIDEINILTQEISKVCPIEGLSQNGKSYIIHFAGTSDENQRIAAQYILDNKESIVSKYDKLEKLDNDFQSDLNAGYTSSYGWKLGLQNNDVLLLSSLFLLAKTCHDNNLPLPEVIDTDGNAHALDIDALTVLMLQYGSYRANLSKTYSEQKKAIENI